MNRTLLSVLFTAALLLSVSSCGERKSRPGSDTRERDIIESEVVLKDYGEQSIALNIEAYTLGNDNFRQALWTGTNLQLTLMAIPVGGDVGLEMHPDIDQFLRIESGEGRVFMGDAENELAFSEPVGEDFVVLVPAGKWHNIVNTGDKPLKLYSIYAPVEHPHGTVHKTQAESMEAEHHH